MAVGKNKRLSKGGKKGMKKKIVDPFTRKDWFDVKAPTLFSNRHIGKTLVNRSQGMKLSSESLKNRSFEVSLADLENDPDSERSFRKFNFIAEEVHGKNVLTNFNGMDFTTDKIRSMVKKWQTLIEAFVDVKTTDGYLLRIFSIGFTKKDMLSQRKACYAQKSRVRAIRRKMVDTIMNRVSTCDLKGFVKELLPDSIAKDIESKCQGIYPMHDVYIRKVKVLKKPRFSSNRLMEMHSCDVDKDDVGVKINRPDKWEPPVQESV